MVGVLQARVLADLVRTSQWVDEGGMECTKLWRGYHTPLTSHVWVLVMHGSRWGGGWEGASDITG
jgi:hypothetical protein